MNKTFTDDVQELVKDWDEDKVVAFRRDFLTWYDMEKRLLPWRVTQQAYNVWVSEIMLQQTQVNTVIPYYERFMEWFPTVEDLAQAPEEKLLKAWEGLGYYSRVRNMQFAAKQVMETYAGEFPKTAAELKNLKGIGPYTAGAIASISYQEVTPAVDGNVMRVFSRLFGITHDIAKPATLKYFDAVVRHVLDSKRPGDMNQATMDLGASICTPTQPKCESCPLKAYCLAYKTKTQANYPVKLKKVKVTKKYYIALAKEDAQGRFEMIKRPSEGLLANLWTFPLIEVAKEDYQAFKEQTSQEENVTLFETKEWHDYLQQMDDTTIWQKQAVGEITHIFSHLKWHVLIAYGRQKELLREATPSEQWYAPKNFNDLALPKPQTKINQLLKQAGYFQEKN